MAEDQLRQVSPRHTTCKICGAQAELLGVTDFHKNCEEIRRKVLTLSGIPVYYHRCPVCDFVFTTAFDGFTQNDFARLIYNDEYQLAIVRSDVGLFQPERSRRVQTDAVLCAAFATRPGLMSR
jgi:hypothetical protein